MVKLSAQLQMLSPKEVAELTTAAPHVVFRPWRSRSPRGRRWISLPLVPRRRPQRRTPDLLQLWAGFVALRATALTNPSPEPVARLDLCPSSLASLCDL